MPSRWHTRGVPGISLGGVSGYAESLAAAKPGPGGAGEVDRAPSML